MKSNVEERRKLMLDLLDKTRRETRALLSSIDPDHVIHTDEPAWCVRDIPGHLGVWNGEAVRSLKSYAEGREYYSHPNRCTILRIQWSRRGGAKGVDDGTGLDGV